MKLYYIRNYIRIEKRSVIFFVFT